MAKNKLLEEAIAEARSIREAAMSNARAALDETFTPKLKEMVARKLQEMDDEKALDERDESAVNEMEDEEIDVDELMSEMDDELNGMSDEDLGLAESEDLDESEEVDEAKKKDDDDKDDKKDDKKDNKKDDKKKTGAKKEKKDDDDKEEKEKDDSPEGGYGDEEEEVKDLSMDELKDMIRDIVSDVTGMGAEEEMPGDDMDMDMGGDMGGMDDASMGLAPTGGDEEVKLDEEESLDELLAEILGEDDINENEAEEISEEESMDEIFDGDYDPYVTAAEGIMAALGVLGGVAATALSEKEIRDALKAKGKNFASWLKSKVKGGGGGESDEAGMDEIAQLTRELNETNLLNAKLLYVNKLFKAHNNLSEAQKLKIVNGLDKASTVKEAKLIYESLELGIASKSKKSTIKESLGFASKPVGGTRQAGIIPHGDDMVARFQKLAGITKTN